MQQKEPSNNYTALAYSTIVLSMLYTLLSRQACCSVEQQQESSSLHPMQTVDLGGAGPL